MTFYVKHPLIVDHTIIIFKIVTKNDPVVPQISIGRYLLRQNKHWLLD